MSWGEIYNTSWWGVALDTARTVKARPDFFGSQLNLLTSEQPNLVVNGTFDNDSDWTLVGSTISISDGKLNFVNAITNTEFAQQSIVAPIGKVYKITLEVSNLSGGDSIKIRYPFQDISINTNGTHTLYGVGVIANFLRITPNSATGTFSIDNVSVQVARAELDQIEAKKCLADWIHTTALKDLNN
jgi:hypothetical protein